jgi:hypothetical protein
MATSTKKRRRNAAQLAADGFAALVEKLGMAEAVRYLQLYDGGAGDYTRERHKWLAMLSQDQIADLMKDAQPKVPRKATQRQAPKAGS